MYVAQIFDQKFGKITDCNILSRRSAYLVKVMMTLAGNMHAYIYGKILLVV